ncbi:nuclear transport factor 2 family protein [Paractinoplanes rhizophilus]|uniref:Nuclear transport factor 2 family protein n=1 Tax=Paractinoplanes rhizophilus TaxID=1416877 RepID=A0ABW2HHN5_9ACTN
MPPVPDDLVRRLADTCARGDLDALEALLHATVVAHCDGGGQVLAAVQPVHGAAGVARLILALLAERPGTELTVESVNGRAGLALRQNGTAVAVMAVAAAATRIAAVWIVLNPAKLHRWHRPG